MKRILSIFIILLLSFVSFTVTNTAAQESNQVIKNDFLNDYNYYRENISDYYSSNWKYCYGDIDVNFDMSYFAPQKSWVGTEAYCEISNGILHPGTNDMVIIVWTAPNNGRAEFTAKANKLYHDNGDGSSMLVYNNAKELLDEEFMPLGDTEYKIYSDNYEIKQDEKIYFVLDYVGNNWSDSTVFDINIELSDISFNSVSRDNIEFIDFLPSAALIITIALLVFILFKTNKNKTGLSNEKSN